MSELNDERFYALREHDRSFEHSKDQFRTAIEGGNAALKALLLVNGGAVVAMLAFAANLQTEDAGKFDGVEDLTLPLLWFGFGVGLSVLASLLAYLANYLYGFGSSKLTYSWEHPYIIDTVASKKWYRIGSCFHVVTLFAAFGSLVVFFIGIYKIHAAVGLLAS